MKGIGLVAIVTFMAGFHLALVMFSLYVYDEHVWATFFALFTVLYIYLAAVVAGDLRRL